MSRALRPARTTSAGRPRSVSVPVPTISGMPDAFTVLWTHDVCRALGVEFHSFSTDQPLIDSVTSFLQRRA